MKWLKKIQCLFVLFVLLMCFSMVSHAENECSDTWSNGYHEWKNTYSSVSSDNNDKIAFAFCCKFCGEPNYDTLIFIDNPWPSSESLELKVGEQYNLNSLINLDENSEIRHCTSTNKKVVNIDDKGDFKTKKPGTVIITTYIYNKTYEVIYSIKICIKVRNVVNTTKVTLNQTSAKLDIGKTIILKVERLPITASDVVTYSSSDTKVATVSSNGKVKAKGPGTANIIVKSGRKTATCKITVPVTKTTKLSFAKKTVTIKKGKSETLKFKRTPAKANDKLTWKSSNAKIATVNSKGKVTAKKKGTVYVTVKAGKVSTRCKVVVK